MKILKRFVESHKMQVIGKFTAVADKPGEIEQKLEIVKKLERKAKKVLKSN